jgi:hypothetical protein
MLVVAAICSLAACASVRAPVTEIAAAEVAVGDAERANAASYASLDLQQARYKLQDAKRAAADNDNLDARRLAEQALIDARIAEAKSQLAKANATLDAAQGRSTASDF